MNRSKARWGLLCVAAIVFLMIVGSVVVRQMSKVAAVQDALERDWEISFNTGERPAWLPATVDEKLGSILQKTLEPEDDSHTFLGARKNRYEIWQERLRAPFRGSISEIAIYYPGQLREDLGTALAAFRGLRRVKIESAGFTEAQWPFVMKGLRRLPHLEELELGGEFLRDGSFEPLAGQESVRSITITEGKLREDFFQIMGTLPALRRLTFAGNAIDDGHDSDQPILPETRDLMRQQLPKIELVEE